LDGYGDFFAQAGEGAAHVAPALELTALRYSNALPIVVVYSYVFVIFVYSFSVAGRRGWR
ncbi:MAG: hypothetical protein K2M12_09665, partial [Muribaculaceae bacterium]|nr:hypothetical protein [Muribaculaceae bacterium]